MGHQFKYKPERWSRAQVEALLHEGLPEILTTGRGDPINDFAEYPAATVMDLCVTILEGCDESGD